MSHCIQQLVAPGGCNGDRNNHHAHDVYDVDGVHEADDGHDVDGVHVHDAEGVLEDFPAVFFHICHGTQIQIQI